MKDELVLRIDGDETRVLQFVVSLSDFCPKIWRRFQIRSDQNLSDFCFAVLKMFCCSGLHPHRLVVGDKANSTFYLPQDDQACDACSETTQNEDSGLVTDGITLASMRDKKVGDIFENNDDTARLQYDFDIGWELEIKLEKTSVVSRLKKEAFAVALAGEGFGIVEDCGGLWGLTEIYEALNNGRITDCFADLDEMRDWLECSLQYDLKSMLDNGFEFCDISDINEQIADLDGLREQYKRHN